MAKRFVAPHIIIPLLLAGCGDNLRHDENAPDPSVGTYGAGLVPGRPIGVAPVGAIGPTPAFTWTVADGESTQFQLWIDGPNGRNLTGGALTAAAAAGCDAGAFPRTCSIASPITLLGGNGTWWVRGRHPVDGFGPWSAARTFTVGCTQPTLVAPTGVTTDGTPTYVWTAQSNVSVYELYVRDSVSVTVVDQILTPAMAGCPAGLGGPDCSFTPAQGVAGGEVSFWVRTCGQAWGTPLTFVYDDTCPGGCDDANPCTDDSCVNGTCLNPDNTAACDDTNACTVGDICSNGSCRATDQNNCRPVPIGPGGDEMGYNVTFQWNELVPPVATYRLWVDDCSGLRVIDEIYDTTQVCAGGICSTSTFPGVPTPLPALSNGRIHWWIQSPPHTDGEVNGSFLFHGPWSNRIDGTNGILTPVTTISPAGTIATNMPTFTWNALPGQDHTYQLWVRDSASMNLLSNTTEVAAGCAQGTGVCTLDPGFTLPAGASSFWVKANYQCVGSNLWSESRPFSVP